MQYQVATARCLLSHEEETSLIKLVNVASGLSSLATPVKEISGPFQEVSSFSNELSVKQDDKYHKRIASIPYIGSNNSIYMQGSPALQQTKKRLFVSNSTPSPHLRTLDPNILAARYHTISRRDLSFAPPPGSRTDLFTTNFAPNFGTDLSPTSVESTKKLMELSTMWKGPFTLSPHNNDFVGRNQVHFNDNIYEAPSQPHVFGKGIGNRIRCVSSDGGDSSVSSNINIDTGVHAAGEVVSPVTVMPPSSRRAARGVLSPPASKFYSADGSLRRIVNNNVVPPVRATKRHTRVTELVSDFSKAFNVRRWKEEEDLMLLTVITETEQKEGRVDWHSVCFRVPGRSAKQCRERWHSQLDPSINRKPWTAFEEKMLIQLHHELGNRWTEIAKNMSGRTDNSVKNQWKSIKRRMESNTVHSSKKRKTMEKTHGAYYTSLAMATPLPETTPQPQHGARTSSSCSRSPSAISIEQPPEAAAVLFSPDRTVSPLLSASDSSSSLVSPEEIHRDVDGYYADREANEVKVGSPALSIESRKRKRSGRLGASR